jgi:CRP-like cAMP-binding protein
MDDVTSIINSAINDYPELWEKMKYKSEESVFKEGEIIEKVYAVESGVFRLFLLDENDNDVTIGFFFQGQIIAPQTSVLLNAGQSFLSLEATTHTLNPSGISVLNCIKMSDWNKMTGEHSRIIGDAARMIFRQTISHHIIDARNHTASKLVTDLIKGNHPLFTSGIQRKKIASYFGITPESLSRIFHNYYKRK